MAMSIPVTSPPHTPPTACLALDEPRFEAPRAPTTPSGRGGVLRDRPAGHPQRRLSEAEEMRLCWKAQAGDRTARERLVLAKQDIVRGQARVAFKAERKRVEMDDLMQEASALLIAAIDSFQPSLGVPFGAYANDRVRNGLAEFSAGQRQLGGMCIGMSRHVWRQVQEVRKASDMLRAAGLQISDETVAERTSLSVSRAREVLLLIAQQRVDVLDEEGEEVAPSCESDDQHERAVARERRRVLLEEIGKLPEEARRAVLADAFDTGEAASAAARRRGLAALSQSRAVRALVSG